MESPEDLTVNLADPSDVQAKLPRAQRMAANLRKQADQLIAQADSWDRLVHVLEGMAPERQNPFVGSQREGDDDVAAKGPSSVDTVVRILDQSGGAMTVAEVHKLAPDFTRKTIGWALWKAAKEGRARSVSGKGVYAPLSYRETMIFDSTNGSDGGQVEQSSSQESVHGLPGERTGSPPG